MANPKVFFDVSIALKPGLTICDFSFIFCAMVPIRGLVSLLRTLILSAGRLVFELFAKDVPKVGRISVISFSFSQTAENFRALWFDV